MAGRHGKTARYRGRHRKPTSPARVMLPAGTAVTAVAVVAAGVIVLSHDNANGQSPRQPLAPAAGIDPHSSVLAFHTVRPSKPVATHHHATEPRHHKPAHHATPAALRIRATADCYVQVTARNGHLLVQRILHRHDHLAFAHHGLRVVLGNAGGAKISVNGHHAHRAGPSGQVRRFHVA